MKRILITGAAGSVGSALTSKLLGADDNIVCAYDNSEDGLFNLYNNNEKNSRLRIFFGDVRDYGRLVDAFKNVDIVYHCAAMKHVSISELNPFDAIQTNVIGVKNVISSALFNNVSKVLFTSSDKAVNPTSTMGTTKLLGEKVCIDANRISGHNPTIFSCVRFGNILESKGSFLHIFKSQYERKLKPTLTSSDMSRFFLTLNDAVDLCVVAADHMVGSELFILSMHSAYVTDVAKYYLNDLELEFDIIGCKPGEKLYEELLTEQEATRACRYNGMVTILPEDRNSLPLKIRSKLEKYDLCEKADQKLRSDQNMLSFDQLHSLFNSSGE